MAIVFLVHSESGSYSDWSYMPLGVFSSYEKAAEYIRSKSLDVIREPESVWTEFDQYEDYDPASERRTIHPASSDGRSWFFDIDGARFWGWDTDAFYIDEFELDIPGRKRNKPDGGNES